LYERKDIIISAVSTVLPWLLNRPSVDLSLNSSAKSETNPGVFKSKYLQICDELPGYCQIYTDGSKTNNGTAAAAVSCDAVKSLHLTSHASIFTAELAALNLALDIIRRSRRKKFVVFSDSLSGLVAIRNCHVETEYVQKFIKNYGQLVNSGKTITLIWIPGHTGIRGNERAKPALCSTVSAMKCPATDLYPELAQHYLNSGRLNGMDAVLINCTLSDHSLVTIASHMPVAETL